MFNIYVSKIIYTGIAYTLVCGHLYVSVRLKKNKQFLVSFLYDLLFTDISKVTGVNHSHYKNSPKTFKTELLKAHVHIIYTIIINILDFNP